MFDLSAYVKYFKKNERSEESPGKNRDIFRTQASIYDEASL